MWWGLYKNPPPRGDGDGDGGGNPYNSGMRRELWRWLLPMLAVFPAACAGGGNFSQYPGFEEIRASLSGDLPTAEERRLLERYRPLLYIADGAEPPLDFYEDYVAHGELRVDGETIRNPSAEVLNAHRDNPQAAFAHHPPKTPPTPAAYGGVSAVDIDWQFVGQRRLTFLSYHFIFRQSGLPAGLGALWRRLANVFADAEDWHQLDHYTAVFVVLDGARPFAVILQQHNYMRTYLIGGEDFPTADDIRVDAAISSNELYPHRAGRVAHPAASFITPDTVDYILELEEDGGFGGVADITDGRRRVDYALKFLPPNDALYVFQGWLGEQRWLPGRDGPPGAIYRSLPALCPLEVALTMFYYLPQDGEYAELVRASGEFWTDAATAEKLRRRFAAAWAEKSAK